ncbi:4-hydroxybutyrate CoA-transferase [Kordiimonas sediminis]|uniref:4-hydroxybutyrate CoA-transferase n=1 Tax=Kordiimonas sediminis TaxID=1735581 RepID=A0A919AL21_9PROT|nr:acetyl-CoA hydrolase/transferase family protein [Kordiimonas sediminis]GHF11036.1 4-hydroxybutyrate CoA-transferase [Kordiimonas sediminis]
MNPQSAYQEKLTSPVDAASVIKDRSNVILGMGVAMPPALMRALADRAYAGSFSSLNVYYMHASHDAMETLLVEDLMDVIRPKPLFMSSHDRALAAKGRNVGKSYVDFVPSAFHQAGRLLTESISPDYFLVTVSPMDKHGYFSLGTNPDYGATVVRKAKHVIVEVNPNMPRVFGECLLHVSDVDAVVEHTADLMETVGKPPSKTDKAIADLIASEIPDGATLQMGVGGVPAAVLSNLENHKDLGLHSELFSPPMVDLIKKGVLTGAEKSILPYKHVFTLALGDRAMFDFMDDNPSIVGYPVSWVNAPSVIRKNRNMISVNAAIEVDLTGQINSEQLDGRPFSGTGGQLDFVRGAYDGKNGKSFIALHSTAKGGTISKIVPRLKGGAVTDPRMDTHYVVTEHGMANMKGLSLRDRAQALISLAAPEFREDLSREANEMGLI